MMFKFLHAADLHLDSPMRGLERYEGAPVEHIRGATRRALENLVQLAIAECVRFVLIAGDLYDGDWKDYNTALFLTGQMSRLRKAGIPVFIIAGNHDAASQITRNLRMPDNVTLLSAEQPQTVRLENAGVAIHGQSFPDRAVREDLSTAYPPASRDLFNIGMLHTSATGREGHEPYAPCSIEGLVSKGYDYWALGHVHRREVLHENPWIVFPGNIHGRHINESGSNGCSLVAVEDGRCSNVGHHDLSIVSWAVCDVDASGVDAPEGILDRVRLKLEQEARSADGRLLAARILISGSTRAHQELISDPEKWVNEVRSAAADLNEGTVWIEQIKIRTQPQTSLEERLAQNDPAAELLQVIESLQPSGEILTPLKDEIAALRSKMPVELLQELAALNLDSADIVGEMFQEAKATLITRLLSTGGGQ